MKKVILSIICVLLCSCVATTGFEETNIIDYSKYYNEGFFLTESNSVSFEYQPIGSIVSVVKGDKKVVEVIEKGESNPNAKLSVRATRGQTVSRTSISYSIYDALDEIVSKSKESGANAIINLKIRFTYDKDYGKGYEITGMAIKK